MRKAPLIEPKKLEHKKILNQKARKKAKGRKENFRHIVFQASTALPMQSLRERIREKEHAARRDAEKLIAKNEKEDKTDDHHEDARRILIQGLINVMTVV